MTTKARYYIAGFAGGGKGHEPMDARNAALKACKNEETDSLPETF
jgi:hypothetical protein